MASASAVGAAAAQPPFVAAARAELASELGAHEEAWLAQPENLAVFAMQSGSNAERTQMLCDMLRWRILHRERLSSLTCTHCAADPRSHDCRIFGTDADGDAVIMNGMALPKELSPYATRGSNPGLADAQTSRPQTTLLLTRLRLASDRAGVEEHMTCVFELALRRFPGTAARPRQFTWVVDIHGFGYLSRHSDPRTSLRLLSLLRNGYKVWSGVGG